MGSELALFLLIPIFFFIAINFIFQDIVSETIDTQIAIITCEAPSFNQAYNETTHVGNPCALVISENTPYNEQEFVLWSVDLNFFSDNSTNNWEATIPYGFITYTFDSITVFFGQAGAVVNLIIAPFTLPSQVDGLFFLWAIEIPLFVMLGFGIYKGISFFS